MNHFELFLAVWLVNAVTYFMQCNAFQALLWVNINYQKHNSFRTWGQLQTTVDKLDIDGVEGSAPALETGESIHEDTCCKQE